MRSRFVFLFVILMIAGLSASSALANNQGSAAMESFWKSTAPITVPVTDKDGTAHIEFPAVPSKPGMTPVVRFKAFLKTKTNAGWARYMKLGLNDKTLLSNTDANKPRILNREMDAKSSAGPVSVYSDALLLTFFTPGTGEIDSRMNTDRDEGCVYLLDISDAVHKVVTGWDNRLESQGTNKLDITNTYKVLTSGETADCTEFVVEDIEVGYLPNDMVKKLQHTESFHMTSTPGPSLRSGDAKIIAGKDGVLEVKVGGESYFYTANYSYPGKETAQYNKMGSEEHSPASWKITRLLEKNSITIKGDYKDYTVVRTITPDGDRFKVCDKITNKTDQPIGMKIRYCTITNNPFSPDSVSLCGSRTLPGTDNCATNPTVFISQAKSSMGLVVEDTVFRLQMEVVRKDNWVEFGTNHFGIEPKKSYTLEWTIYPSKSVDYWDFVNRVRKNWNVNFTVLGPCPLGDENIVPGRKARIYPINPWLGYHNGCKLSREEYKALVKPKVQKLLAAQPDAIPMGLVESNLVPYDTRKADGKLPQGTMNGPDALRTGYGLELNAAETELIKKLPWWDSEIKTRDGRGVIDTYYAEAPYLDLLVYPAPGNYQLKFMKQQADFLMNEVGMKGVYMDDFNLGIRLSQPGRCDYSKWDGHTVDLKTNGEIDRKYTDCTLIGSPARAEIIRNVLSKGGLVLTNGHPVARETTGLQIHAFAETEWDLESVDALLKWTEPPYLPAIAEAHLSSPISLGIRPSRFGKVGEENTAEIIHRWVIACLKNGTLYVYYTFTIPTTGPGAGEYGIVNHMYPFTPVELHSGWLIGKERILTAKSGSFYWNNAEKPAVLAFDIKGHEIKPERVNIVKKGSGWQVDLGIKDWLQTAVIESPNDKH